MLGEAMSEKLKILMATVIAYFVFFIFFRLHIELS